MDKVDEAIIELFAASDALYEELSTHFQTPTLERWFAAYNRIRAVRAEGRDDNGEAEVSNS